jgi:hypothetical protein
VFDRNGWNWVNLSAVQPEQGLSSRREDASDAKIRRMRLFVTSSLAALLLAVGASQASALPYLPPAGKVFAGETGQPVSQYVAAVGKHPAVYQEFLAWGQYIPGITQDAISAHARMMMAIGTSFGSRQVITPAGIAAGQGDGWLIALQNAIAQSHNITYIRLMAEMDGYWNVYCAYNADGSFRGAAHSQAAYKQAWRRVTLIMRGGRLATIDAELHRLGMPRLHTNHDLPRAQVAMLWVPELQPGDPAVPGNQPSAYWPGGQWVDWVGTDFYSNAPNFSGLQTFYSQYSFKPFVFAEYALWNSGDDVGFVDRLFGWVGSHPDVRMMLYNQGVSVTGPFRLYRYPNSSRELRRLLASSKFLAYAPEWAR